MVSMTKNLFQLYFILTILFDYEFGMLQVLIF